MSVRRSRSLLAAAGFIAVLSIGPYARAQEDTVYIGGSAPHGAVEVDMSVLDGMGNNIGRSGQTLLRPPGSPMGQRITLTPPGQKAQKAAPQHRTATKAKPLTPRKAPAPTAPKAAAPSAPAAVTAASVAPAEAVTTAVSDLPPPPPPPIEITLPPAAPAPETKPVSLVPETRPVSLVPASATSVAPAVTKAVESSAPTPVPTKDLKPAPSAPPVMAVKELQAPASSAVRLPELEPTVMAAAMSADPAPVAAPKAAAPVTAPAPAAAIRTASAQPEPQKPAPQAVTDMATTQTAALAPPSQGAAGKQSTRIAFAREAATLPEPSKGDLKQIAGSLSKDPALRVQVMAYASGSDDASKARRLSLSRALAVRSFLIEQGIGSTRIDVRALGNATEGGPSDRVDLMVLSR